MDLPRFDRRNMSDEIYEVLKDKIIQQDFAPGERLNLGEIGKQLNVSRTPLKDALNRLSVEGLVDIQPRRGTYVSAPTKEEIAEAFDVRNVLELYAAALAIPQMKEQHLEKMRAMVKRMRSLVSGEDWTSIYQQYASLDHAFHRFLVELSGNGRLLWVFDHVNVHVPVARVRHLQAAGALNLTQQEHERIEEEVNLTQREHEQIMAGLEARDAEAVARELKSHLKRAKSSLLADMQRMWHPKDVRG